MDLASARSYLKEARELSDLANDTWVMTYDERTDANEISITDTDTGEIVPIAHVLPDCPFGDRELMLKAPTLLTATLTLLDEAFRIIKGNQPPGQRKRSDNRPSGDYAAECAMRCGDQLFRQFLLEKKGAKDVSDETRIASEVRYLLKIDSRSELNHDAGARNRWFDLRVEFENWKRGL